MGRGTTGIVCATHDRNFTGIDLYPTNVAKAEKNIKKAMIGRNAIDLDTVDENFASANKITSLEYYINS
jgi:tRNA/tmRNA/rRNA uracil-C5-methylase (TrmA/RlmC/RlmD family)